MTLEMVSTQQLTNTVGTDEVAVVHMNGDCDARSRAELASSLRQALSTNPSVIVDLAEVHVCDENVTGVFLAADADAKARGASLAFRHVLPTVRNVFEGCGLDWRIQVGAHPDL